VKLIVAPKYRLKEFKKVFSLQEFSFMNQQNTKAKIEQGILLKSVQ
jgi:hypothetical protein